MSQNAGATPFVKGIIVSILVLLLIPYVSTSQQSNISDFAVFGGNASCPTGAGQTPCNSPGCAVQLGGSTVINGGAVGSYKLVTTTGSVNITGNIYSGGTITLAGSNTVGGKIGALNLQNLALTSNIFTAGTYSTLKGNIDVKGSIKISSGTVSGIVTYPSGATYSGPNPASKVVGTPSIPGMPTMPAITTFPAYGATSITTTQAISPGAYSDVNLGSNKTLT